MELRLPEIQEIEKVNPINGRFLKGHTPWNKGKKATEYLSEEKLEKLRTILRKYKKNGNPNFGGHNKRAVLVFQNGELIARYESSAAAARALNIWATNIRKVCNGQREMAGNYQFSWEDEI